jgi:hypothetical protein
LALAADVLHLFVHASSDHLAERLLEGSDWGPWQDLGGTITASPAAVGSPAREQIQVAAGVEEAGEAGVWLRSWPFERPCYAELACGQCAEPCSDGDCQVYSAVVADPAHYRRSDGEDALVVRSSDSHLYHFSHAGEWVLSDIVSSGNGGAALAGGAPHAFARSDHYDSICYRTLDNEIGEIVDDGGTWAFSSMSDFALGPDARGNPVPYARSDGTNSVMYRAVDDHLYEIYSWNGGWYAADLSGSVGAPNAGGDPYPFIRADNVNAIVYRDVRSQLHEIYLDNSVGWRSGALAPAAGLADALGDPAAYVRADYRNAVVYLGKDSHVHELSSAWYDHVWTLRDLTASAGAPLAAGNPRGYVTADRADAVVYRAADAHVYELRRGGDQWFTTDLSEAAGAPAAASNPVPYVRADGVGAIAYVAQDGSLRELSWVAGAWLSSVIFAPSAP